MSQWVERFEQHPVHKEVQSLFDALTEASPRLEGNPVASASHSRVHEINLQLRRVLTSVDPTLVPVGALSNLVSLVAAEAQEVRNFNGNGNTGHLDNANQHADNVLTHIASIPAPRSPSDLEAIAEAVGTVRRTASENLKLLRGETATLQQALNDLNAKIQEGVSEITAQKGVLSTAITQFQQQFLQAEESRSTQFVQAEQSRSEQATQTDSARKEQFTKAAEEQREAFRTLLEQARENRAALAQEMKEGTDQILASMNAARSEVEQLVGIIGATGVVSGYKRVADEQQKLAARWNLIATLSMVGLIVFACFAFLPSLSGGFHWGSFAGRVFVSLTFGVLSAFAARQGEKHQQVERRNRRLELELASVGPFIAALPEPQQQEVKRQLVDRMFGQQEPSSGEATVPTGTMLDAIKLIVQNAPKQS